MDITPSLPKRDGTLAHSIEMSVPDDLRIGDTREGQRSFPPEEQTLDALLRQTLRSLIVQLRDNAGVLWLADVGRNVTCLYFEFDGSSFTYAADLNAPPQPIQVASRCMLFGDPRAYEDVASEPTLAPFREYLRSRRVKSLLVVPLHSNTSCVGIFATYSKTRRRYRTADLSCAADLAFPATLAIRFRHLAERCQDVAIRRQREDLARVIDSAIIRAVNDSLVHAGRYSEGGPSDASQTVSGAKVGDPLTRRQHQVLQLVAAGMSNRDIGLALGMTEGTAKTHVASILDRLGAENRIGAVTMAIRLGLLRLR